MPDQPSAVSGAFRRPFREQVAFFRQKLGNLVPTERWDDVTGVAHDTAFMVAGAQKADLLADLAAAVDRSIAEGKGLEAFRRDFDAAVERHGWHGWTGEGTKGGRAWRTRTIYRTNATVAYAAGRRAQLEAANWPLWVYLHGGSKDPRPEHLQIFHGLVLPPDHLFWEKHYPPSDWGCSCYVVGARSERGARRLGGDPSRTLPDGWDKLDPATGEPAGIGKGWGYAPGASVAQTIRALVHKSGGWQYDIAKSFMQSVPESVRDRFAETYREAPGLRAEVRGYAAAVLGGDGPEDDARRTLGLVTSADVARIGAMLGRDLTGFDWSLTPSAVRHVQHHHGNAAAETARGQRAITLDDYPRLLDVLAAPAGVVPLPTSGIGEPQVQLTREIDGELFTAVFAMFAGKRRTLTLKTMYVRPI